MKRSFKFYQSIYFKIPLLFIMILLIAFQFVAVYFTGQLEEQTAAQFKTTVNTQADFLVSNLTSILSDTTQEQSAQTERLNQALSAFTVNQRTDISVINAEEYVIATNYSAQSNTIGTKINQPKVKEVLVSQRSFVNESYDANKKQHMYTLIRPIIRYETDEAIGAVILSANMNRVYEQSTSIMELFFRSAAVAIAGSVFISITLSQSLTQPIEKIRQQAVRISQGIYNQPVPVSGQDELGELALTINELSDKVQDAQETTEAERQRLDGVLRHMTDGVIATDRHGVILLVNDCALRLLQLTKSDTIGQPLMQLLDFPDEIRLRDLLSGGGDSEVLITRENDNQLATILKCEFSLVRRETGFISGLVCVLTDVTEQEKTEQERRDFVSNVSHELRTPLTSIKSYAEALLDGAMNQPDIAPHFVEVIYSESDRMYRMVDNLMNLSKIHDGKIDLQLEFVDFKRFVQSIIERYRFTLANDEQYQDDHISLETEFTSREIFVEIDTDWITQVIDNLLNNAIKYSPDGGVILIRVVETHQTITLSITDQGLGIPQNDIENIFDRFYRVDKARSRERGGTGLGLAISKEVLELHHGNLWVESVENHGSTFGIDLPFEPMDLFGSDDDWGDLA